MNEESFPPAPAGLCPICSATNAYVEALGDRDAVFVECVNCRVYRATRKAFRHFEYLRWRQDPLGLAKLARLAAALKHHKPTSPVRLDYDTWEIVADELGRGEELASIPAEVVDMLRDKYSHAIQVAKGFRMQGAADERDGKLYFKGTVNSEDEKNRIWDAIKTVPDWRNDIVGEITVNPQAAPAPAKGGTTYTVKSGDTLSKIAKELLGDANAYNAIFAANRDQLDDADKIKPGQVLKIPAAH